MTYIKCIVCEKEIVVSSIRAGKHLCDMCIKDGWLTGQDMVNEIARDHELRDKVSIISPIQQTP